MNISNWWSWHLWKLQLHEHELISDVLDDLLVRLCEQTMVVNEDQLAEERQYTGRVPQHGIEVLPGINYTVWKVMFWFSWFLHQFRKIEPVWILVTMLISLDKFCGWSRISKGDAPTPKRGAPTYYLVKVCRKLDENERNLTEVGNAYP